MVHSIKCSEIWGGHRGDQLDVQTSGVRASLFSRECDGGTGGDLYYFSVCDNDLLTRIAIADVMGHGSVVSDTGEWLYHTLKRHMNSLEGNAVLADLNAASVEKGHQAMTTMTVAAFYRLNRTLYFSYTGHPEVLLARSGSPEWHALRGQDSERLTDIPLGVDAEARYVQNCVRLSAGDRLCLYTDGVLEAPDAEGEEFGRQRLIETLQSTSSREDLGHGRDRVVDALLANTGHTLAHDDVTFMAVDILA